MILFFRCASTSRASHCWRGRAKRNPGAFFIGIESILFFCHLCFFRRKADRVTMASCRNTVTTSRKTIVIRTTLGRFVPHLFSVSGPFSCSLETLSFQVQATLHNDFWRDFWPWSAVMEPWARIRSWSRYPSTLSLDRR